MKSQDTTTRKQIYVAILTEKDKLQATNLITDTFCELNPVWSHYVTNQQTQKQLQSYVSQFVDKSFETHLLYAAMDVHTRQMISVGVYLDMVDYVNILQQIKGKYDHIKLIHQLGICGQELEKDLRSKKHNYGDSVIVVLGASKKI